MRRAFTLIEVMLVALLIGALAGAAAVSFARPLRAARARQGVAQIGAFDAAARQAARRVARDVEIVIDADQRQLVRREDGRDVAVLRLPGALHIEQVRSGGNERDSAQLTVVISPHGRSRSYALRVVGPEVDRWLLVAGLSGQVSVIEDESKVQDILARIAAVAAAAPRRDVD